MVPVPTKQSLEAGRDHVSGASLYPQSIASTCLIHSRFLKMSNQAESDMWRKDSLV